MSQRRLPSTGSTAKSETPTGPTLAAIGDIARWLAAGDAIGGVVDRILVLVRDVLAADESAVWLQRTDGLVRVWGSGEERLDAAALDCAAGADSVGDGEGERALCVPLTAAGRRLGILAVRTSTPLEPERQLFFQTVGNLLAPVLAHDELLQQMSVEVRLRTRQIDEQRRFTEKIIDSLPVGLHVIDREYRIQAWNRKRETGMQGVSREEAIGRTIFEILHRQPAELLRREFEDVFRTGRMQTFQMESTATGDVRTYRISKIPMRLDDANVTHVITIGEDITEWREAEERFAQTEKLAAIGTLAAGVMHEINNPLATIAACGESLALRLDDLAEAGAALPADCDDYIKIIDEEVQRCKTIIDGLLDFSRPKPLTKGPLSVNGVIERTLFLLKHHARFKKVSVETEFDPAVGADVLGNPEQLVQVFMALLLNAMDAMGESGKVTLRSKRRRAAGEESIVVDVVDEGQGIPRTELSKIFEPFYTTKPPGRGTGLGLSICYGIIAEHGGRMEVDSQPGKGTTFRIILPAGKTA